MRHFNRIKILLLLAITILFLIQSVNATTTLKINPIEDTFVISLGDKNKLGNDLLIINMNKFGYEITANSLLKFDLTSLPKNITIDSAELRLYDSKINGETPHIKISSYNNNSWDKSTTWQNMPTGISTFLSEQILSNTGYYSWNVKQAINNSVITLLLEPNSTNIAATFNSTSSLDPTNIPVLTINYTQNTNPSSLTPIAKMNKVLDIPNAEAFVVTGGNSYIFAGQDENASISMTDANGNLICRNSFDKDNYSYFSSITSYYQGGFIAVGTSQHEIPNSNDEWISTGLIVRIDDNCNEVWKKYVHEGNFLAFKKIVETWDGFVIVGEYMDNNPQSIFIMKINSIGDSMGSGTITNSTNYDYVSDVKQTFTKSNTYNGIDRGQIVTGSTNDGKDGLIIKINGTTGQPQWTKVLKNKGTISSIIPLSSGYYIATGYRGGSYPNPKNSWIMKLNKNGKIKWTKYISKGIHNEINSGKPTKGGYILAGTLYGKTNEPNGGMLIKVDKRGNEIWSIVPGDNIYSKLYDVIETSKNKYTAFGYKCNVDTDECGVYFVKIVEKKN